MTVLTPPTLPSGFKDPPDGPIIYAFEPLWGGATVYFPRYAYEWEMRQSFYPHSVSPPGVPGAWDTDGQNWHWWGPMTISVRFKAHSSAERRSIMSGCIGAGRLWMYDDNQAYLWTPARLREPRAAVDIYDMAHKLYSVVLDFECPLGAWLAERTDPGGLYGYARYGLDVYGGASAEIPLAGVAVEQEILNHGDLPCLAMAITLAADTMGLDNPVLTNVETGQALTFGGILAAGTSWVLDTSVPSLLKDGADDWDNLSLAADKQGIFWLLPGYNTVTVTAGDDMDGTVTFYFWPAYKV